MLGCLAGLALLQPAVEAIFLGPIAVGAVIGALAVGKGFLLGSLLSRKRSRKQSYRYWEHGWANNETNTIYIQDQ